MIKAILSAACLVGLAGCYTVNDQPFARHVETLVEPGLTMPAAIRRLEDDGFACGPDAPPPLKSCSKMRQRFWPSTCIERVNLRAVESSNVVERVEIVPIVCAGL